MKKIFSALIGALALSPVLVSAQALTKTILLISNASFIINMLIYIAASIALLVFIWGIVKYVGSAGNADAAKEGKSIMIYGVIALFVLFSIWGIIRFLGSDLGVNTSQPLPPPQLQ